ncbi:MAG: cation-translocating P-type ATPase C-terminal domain-containing protein, partial [Candidatus Poseidoniaceae archaeon]|nr:cation-translocating P-type ATPase C-terminal domain-containing protein [Candidatus Poseidoniaceae archaeon]
LCNDGDVDALSDWQNYADDRFVHAQTMTLSVFIMFQLFNVMNCRSQEESIFSLGAFSNKAINIAFFVSFGLLLFFVQLANITIPLTDIEIGGLLSTKVLSMSDW